MQTDITTVDDAVSFVALRATQDDLDRIARAHRERQDYLSTVATHQLRVGHRVRWTGKRGTHQAGVIEKVNRKTCTVRSDKGVVWRVSSSLLEEDTNG